MPRRLWARESVGFLAQYTLTNSAGAAVDITGWSFAQSFARVAGADDVTLGMAASAAAQGFFITNAAAGQYQLRITPATLVGIADATGNFTMNGDIIASLPDGSRLFIEDQCLQVTEGPTP